GDPRLLLAQHVPRAVDADGQDRQLQTARESEAALTKVQEAPVGAAGPLRSDPDAEAELPKLQTALLHHAVRLGAAAPVDAHELRGEHRPPPDRDPEELLLRHHAKRQR